MKARGGKSGSTSPDEKTDEAPSVAKLPINPAGGRGELRALGGGKHDEWNQGLTAQLAGSLPEARGSNHGGHRRGFARRSDWADRYRSAGPGGRHAERPNDRGERRSARPLPAGLGPGTEFRSEYKIPGTRRQGCPNARAALRGARPSPRERPTADHRDARHRERRPGRHRGYRGGRQQGNRRDL